MQHVYKVGHTDKAWNFRGVLLPIGYAKSYRDETGRSEWRSVIGLGRMENFSKEPRKGFVTRLNEMLKGEPSMFIAADDSWAEVYTREIFYKCLFHSKSIPFYLIWNY